MEHINVCPALSAFARLVGMLQAEPGKNAKHAILVAGTTGDDPVTTEVRELLRLALDPYITFGVAKFDTPTGPIVPIDGRFGSVGWVKNLCNDLASRTLTGSRAHAAIQSNLAVLPNEPATGELLSQREVIARLLRKDLKCGVSVGGSTIAKACPGLVRGFDCQLAASEMPQPGDLTYPQAVEPKYDGVRTIAIIEKDGKVSLLGRSGLQFVNFLEIEEAVAGLGLRSTVLDGEILGQNHETQYTDVMRRVNGKPGRNDDIPVVFRVFDIMELNRFINKDDRLIWSVRRAALERLLSPDAIISTKGLVQLSPSQIANSPEELLAIYRGYVDLKFEGVIAKDPNAIYDFKRSKSWRKLKPMIETGSDADLEIVGFVEGKGKLAGTLGAIELKGEIGERKVECNCGSGFSETLRRQIWDNRGNLLGSIAEVRYQDMTLAQGSTIYSLRFVTFVRLRAMAGGVKV